jgi:phosphatidylserine decarboxylase
MPCAHTPSIIVLQNLSGFLNTLVLRIAPQRALARLAHRLTRVRAPVLKNILIRLFVRLYHVDMSEAAEPDIRAYPDFNSFFVRALRPDARPLPRAPDEIAIPADSAVSQSGILNGDRLIQAKGIDYRVSALLGAPHGEAGGEAGRFTGGHYATLYLSPRDYHRVHMPLDGELRAMRYIPGELFSVNDYSTRHVHGLFTRNERLVTLFDTAAGPMAVILVGAIFVAGIETVWTGALSAGAPRGHWHEGKTPVRLARGAELGRFNMGSTVIVLFGPGRVAWVDTLIPGATVKMGRTMGRIALPERGQITFPRPEET